MARYVPPWLNRFHNFKKVTLTDYKVRILDSSTGTAAKTRVLIQSSDGNANGARSV